MIDTKKKIDEGEINDAENIELQEPVEDNSNENAESVSESVTDSVSASDDENVVEENSQGDDDADTFPRDYVEKLRDENAKYRQRAQRADDLAQRLHAALVEGSGRLQDAGDLPFDESHIDDPEALTGGIDELLKAKPHLAARRPTGNIGQGASGAGTTVDLAALMRSRA